MLNGSGLNVKTIHSHLNRDAMRFKRLTLLYLSGVFAKAATLLRLTPIVDGYKAWRPILEIKLDVFKHVSYIVIADNTSVARHNPDTVIYDIEQFRIRFHHPIPAREIRYIRR